MNKRMSYQLLEDCTKYALDFQIQEKKDLLDYGFIGQEDYEKEVAKVGRDVFATRMAIGFPHFQSDERNWGNLKIMQEMATEEYYKRLPVPDSLHGKMHYDDYIKYNRRNAQLMLEYYNKVRPIYIDDAVKEFRIIIKAFEEINNMEYADDIVAVLKILLMQIEDKSDADAVFDIEEWTERTIEALKTSTSYTMQAVRNFLNKKIVRKVEAI